MPANATIIGKVAKEFIQRFPNASTRALARMLVRDTPTLFRNELQAGNVVRWHRGAAGKKSRLPGRVRTTPKLASVARIPKGLTHFNNWDLVNIPVPAKALVLSDIHVPYHDRRACELAIKFGKAQRADMVILNGDFLDFFALSRWEKDPRKRDFKAELDVATTFLRYLRDAFPKARIIFKEGNHEERWFSYMALKAPELLGIDAIHYSALLDLKGLGIEYIKDRRPIRLGKLVLVHGHEFATSIFNPVNPARGLFLRSKVSSMCGHHHQSSQHSEKNLEQRVVSCWSTGCLCELHPDYMPINNHNHGFAFVRVAADGAYQVDNKRIIDGKVY